MGTRPVVIVTGASVGIGRAVCSALASDGYDVVGGSRRSERLETVAGEVEAAGASFLRIIGDVRERATAEAAVAQALERFGRLDALVNNAAAGFRCRAQDLSENGWNATVGITLAGTWWFSVAAARAMLAQERGGVIVNMASVGGQQPSAMMAAYGAAKAGVVSLTRSLAVEWAPRVRVVCVVPGSVLTEGTAAFLPEPSAMAAMVARIPAGRLGAPEELAAVVAFLASDAASFVSGAVINVDGGGLRWEIDRDEG